MIKAGNHTVSDKGFTVVTENIGGVPRQAVVAELPGGISDEALAAFCAGPIELLAEDGSTTATYTGPFRVVSHGLKLTRTSEDSDVAALTAQVAELEAKLKSVLLVGGSNSSLRASPYLIAMGGQCRRHFRAWL